MLKFDFDAELNGADGAIIPVYCGVQPAHVGGQKSLIEIAVPAQYISANPPSNPCEIQGKGNGFTINIQGAHWRRFPTSSKGNLGLRTVELLHVERLIIQQKHFGKSSGQIRFHLAPISYLRSESSCVSFGKKSCSENLFVLNLPGIGPTSFVMESVTIYHRDAEIPGATVHAGFSALADLPSNGPTEANKIVAIFKRSLEALSVLFRQAVTVHGWTYSVDGQTISTWNAPLAPNAPPSAREERGDFVAMPQVFVEYATKLTLGYEKSDEKTRSLARHIFLTINPYNNLRDEDHFLFMFSALERLIEAAWKRDKTPNSPAATTPALIKHLEQLRETVISEDDPNASTISERLEGLINVVNRPSFQDKLNAFFRVYPAMNYYCRDLWPIVGTSKERGLREIRHSLAHGSGSLMSINAVAVAKWHLAILLERMVFVLLGIPLPDGISPDSYSLQLGGRGWYEREWWVPLRSEPKQPI